MIVDLGPLLRGAGAEDVRIGGVAVGEPAAGIDPTVVDSIVSEDGVLGCGDAALVVKDGLVAEIYVRGPSLETLGISREDDIERVFGPAGGHERTLGWRIHHYPERRFAIGWQVRERRVEHVRLGGRPWQEPRLGAPTLLFEILTASPVLAATDWAEPDDRLTKVRYGRVAALSSALGLGTPAALVAGRFFPDPLDAGRRRVLAELAASGKSSQPVVDGAVGLLFRHLLRYRSDVEKVVHFAGGWLEAGLGFDAVATLEGRIGDQVSALMTDIDRWLCTLMDPAERSFGMRELIAHHGWPDVDLFQLEMDYELGIEDDP